MLGEVGELLGDRVSLVPSTLGVADVLELGLDEVDADPLGEPEGEPVDVAVADTDGDPVGDVDGDIDVEIVGRIDDGSVGDPPEAELVGDTDDELVGDAVAELVADWVGETEADGELVGDCDCDADAETVGEAVAELVADPLGVGLGDVLTAVQSPDSCMSLLPSDETVACAALLSGVPTSATRVSSLGVQTTAPLPDWTTTPFDVSVVVTVMIPAEAKSTVNELMPELPAPAKCQPTPECDCCTSWKSQL